MSQLQQSIHPQWSSRMAFILAATGAAVGLGNIWKFPYITGENGGGAFVLVYLVCLALVATPIMISEIMLGRRSRMNPIQGMERLSRESNVSTIWQGVGWLGVVAGFIILSYYAVIMGWSLAYIFRAGSGAFEGADASQTRQLFEAVVGDPERLLLWHTIAIVITTIVVARGV
ncbi:MAG TPA: sodium-dependent transporter, partial [Halothiobacillus sp.]|nr:sodium-dependent transporter [Halothiobacillus sp.]